MGTFKELRIGFVDDGRTITILPRLLPDVVEQHGDPDDAVTIVNTEDRTNRLVPSEQDTTASPVLLLVPPTSKAPRS